MLSMMNNMRKATATTPKLINSVTSLHYDLNVGLERSIFHHRNWKILVLGNNIPFGSFSFSKRVGTFPSQKMIMKRFFSAKAIPKDKFITLLNKISGGKSKERIQEALNNSDIENEGKLREMIRGVVASKENPIAFLMMDDVLGLNRMDAATLAGKLLKPSPTFPLFVFPNTAESDDFPFHSVGRKILPRQHLINAYCNLILNKKFESGCSNYYWRAQSGSGKTAFLHILGRELLKRGGCTVYYFRTASRLGDVKPSDLEAIIDENIGVGKKTIVIVDEAQDDRFNSMWIELLRNNREVIVLGAGTNYDDPSASTSARFTTVYDANELFLSPDEVDDVVDLWSFPDSDTMVLFRAVCLHVIAYTSGLMYPTMILCQYMYRWIQNPNNETSDAFVHMTSAEYYESSVFDRAYTRCFYNSSNAVKDCIEMMRGDDTAQDRLTKYGFWYEGNLYSDFFRTYIVRQYPLEAGHQSTFEIIPKSEGGDYVSNAVTIMKAGLSTMQAKDFNEHGTKLHKIETALSTLWALQLHQQIPNLTISPQTRTYLGKCGHPPCVDFCFDGKVDLAIEFIRDGNDTDIVTHSTKFSETSDYQAWNGKSVLFNFNLSPSRDVTVHAERTAEGIPLYEFNKYYNVLVCGTQIIATDVVKALNTPMMIKEWPPITVTKGFVHTQL